MTLEEEGWLQMTEDECALFGSATFLVHVGKSIHIFPNSDRWDEVRYDTDLALEDALPRLDMPSTQGESKPIERGTTMISFASADQEYADQLAAHLASHSIDVWHYVPDVPFGAMLVSPLEHMMLHASSLIVLMSPESNASEWVRREMCQAHARGLPILPVLLRGAPFPDFAGQHYFDATNGELPPGTLIDEFK